MEVLKFNLSGKTAFFKIPDVNTYTYFSYGHIHKVAILGILGAILGYKGYNQQDDKDKFPEFYEKLKNIKIGIIPLGKYGSFSKKIQCFNNSVGYASYEEGGNLIVKEQWLEDVSWDIYISLDDFSYDSKILEITKELKERFVEKRFIYNIYLGKNDHVANITDVKILKAKDIKESEIVVDSLFFKGEGVEAEEEFPLEKIMGESDFWYEEGLPTEVEETSNQYISSVFIYTNKKMNIDKKKEYYKNINDKIIRFF